MSKLNPTKTGLAVGLLMGGWHVMWSILVAVGVAQWVIDFVFWMHFLRPVFMVESFDLARMLILVAVTSALGLLIGYALALLWNGLHGRAA